MLLDHKLYSLPNTAKRRGKAISVYGEGLGFFAHEIKSDKVYLWENSMILPGGSAPIRCQSNEGCHVMKQTGPSEIHPLQRYCGYLGRDFRVVLGVNQRDGMCCEQDLVAGDTYRMDAGFARHILRGAVQFQALLVLMTRNGHSLTVAIGTDPWNETVLLASDEITRDTKYELIKVETSRPQITKFVHAAGNTTLPAQSHSAETGLHAVQL